MQVKYNKNRPQSHFHVVCIFSWRHKWFWFEEAIFVNL